MNKRSAFVISAFAIALAAKPALAEEHDHKKDKKPHAKQTEVSKKKKKGHDHKHEHKEGEKDQHEEGEHKDEEEGHDHKKDGAKNEHGHGEEEEGAKNVGPEKGITSFDEEIGFTLSKEALKTFSIETVNLRGPSPWTVPISSLLLTGEEKSVYRVREGTFKRIDINVVSKNKSEAVIESNELGNGDQIVTRGVGNVRIAEVDATSGESGHHH